MSRQIRQELKAQGLATVIVLLKARAREMSAAEVKAGLGKHFKAPDTRRCGGVAGAKGVRGLPPLRYYPHLGAGLGTVDRDGLADLRAQTDIVARVTGAPPLGLIRPVKTAAAGPAGKVTWGLTQLGAPDLWKQGLTGEGVLVGHLDTGVDGKHPALKKVIAHFAEFDDLGRPRRPAPRPHDTDEHGTHTAATIAGRPAGGRSVGVAPGAQLASAIVIEGGDVVARVLGGMDWAVGRGVRVLSMSLGFQGWWDDFLPLTERLRALGVLPVFAVGNEGPGTSRSPGNYWQALSVGACDRRQAVADFSSSQSFKRPRDPVVPDLVAPGVEVVSAMPGGGYQMMDGTSMATPHVAGLAALLWQARPDAGVNDVERAIFESCRPGPGMKPQRGNRGIPHAGRALEALIGAAPKRAKTDPVLLEQIEAAAQRRKPIDAVFTLRQPRRKAAGPGAIEDLARKVLDRVAAAAGITYGDVNVFGNLGAFAISAEPAFLRALIRAPEIAVATASRRGRDLLIRPRRKRPIRP